MYGIPAWSHKQMAHLNLTRLLFATSSYERLFLLSSLYRIQPKALVPSRVELVPKAYCSTSISSHSSSKPISQKPTNPRLNDKEWLGTFEPLPDDPKLRKLIAKDASYAIYTQYFSSNKSNRKAIRLRRAHLDAIRKYVDPFPRTFEEFLQHANSANMIEDIPIRGWEGMWNNMVDISRNKGIYKDHCMLDKKYRNNVASSSQNGNLVNDEKKRLKAIVSTKIREWFKIVLKMYDSCQVSTWHETNRPQKEEEEVERQKFVIKCTLPPKRYDENFGSTPLEFVTNVEGLKELVKKLKTEKEIGIDTEGLYPDSDGNIVHLVQISTRNTDYIIDPQPIRSDMHILNEIFDNPDILKVGHSIHADVKFLNDAFGICTMNFFDTYLAFTMVEPDVNLIGSSLKSMVYKYFGVSLKKSPGNSNQRPISTKLIQYARGDIHFLLPCYDVLMTELREKNLLDEMNRRMGKIQRGARKRFNFEPKASDS